MMENLLVLLPLLACPVGMFLGMWLMGKTMRSDKSESLADRPAIEDPSKEEERLAA
jgi:hypothetical protein